MYLHFFNEIEHKVHYFLGNTCRVRHYLRSRKSKDGVAKLDDLAFPDLVLAKSDAIPMVLETIAFDYKSLDVFESCLLTINYAIQNIRSISYDNIGSDLVGQPQVRNHPEISRERGHLNEISTITREESVNLIHKISITVPQLNRFVSRNMTKVRRDRIKAAHKGICHLFLDRGFAEFFNEIKRMSKVSLPRETQYLLNIIRILNFSKMPLNRFSSNLFRKLAVELNTLEFCRIDHKQILA